MADSTLPPDAALMRISDFQRRQAEPVADQADVGITRLSQLNPSLMQDLMRFEREHRPGEGLEPLEVVAASLRHSRDVQIFLQLDYRVIPLVVRPRDRKLALPMALAQFLQLRLPALRVLRVEPAPATDAELVDPERPTDTWHVSPLAPLLWELALRGARETLLPEIGGIASYRVAPGADLAVLDLTGSLGAAVARLRQEVVPLRDIARWPGFDRSRAERMLNGLYLQAALMVSRTHPGAIGSA